MNSVQQYIYQCVKDSNDVTVGNDDCFIDINAAEARYYKTCFDSLDRVESDAYSQSSHAYVMKYKALYNQES